jgi:hypothetical protein
MIFSATVLRQNYPVLSKTYKSNLKETLISPQLLDRTGSRTHWVQDIYSHNEGYYIEYLKQNHPQLCFMVDRSNTIYYSSTDEIPRKTLETVVKGAPWRLWLQLQKRFCLHASGIEINHKAILMLGEKGSGKSTLAAYLHSCGHAICCDDVSLLLPNEKNYSIFRSDKHLRVTPDTAFGLNLEKHHLSPLFPGLLPEDPSFKYSYSLPSPVKKQEYLPLSSLLLLSEAEEVSLKLTSPADAFAFLLQEMLMKDVVQADYLRFYFSELKNLLEAVPVYTLSRPKTWESLKNTYELITKL